MQYILLGTAIMLCLFFVPFSLWAYRRGIKDGLAVRNNEPIQPIRTPVQVVSDYKQGKAQSKAQDAITEGLANLLNYDGEPQDNPK
jgi:hypothetical protein